jgi:hypothetical protein
MAAYGENLMATVSRSDRSSDPAPKLHLWPGRNSQASATSGTLSSQATVPDHGWRGTCSSSRAGISAPAPADVLSAESQHRRLLLLSVRPRWAAGVQWRHPGGAVEFGASAASARSDCLGCCGAGWDTPRVS